MHAAYTTGWLSPVADGLVSCFCRPTGKHCLSKWERRDSQVWLFSEVLRRLIQRVSSCMTVQDCKAMRNSPWPLGHKRQESATVQAGRNMSARQSTLDIRYTAPSKFSRGRLTCGHKRPGRILPYTNIAQYRSIQKQQAHWNTEHPFGWEIQELISSRVTKEFRDHSVIMQICAVTFTRENSFQYGNNMSFCWVIPQSLKHLKPRRYTGRYF